MTRKKRPEGTRAPNGASSVYQGRDGKWHGRVTMGVRDDGKPDRRHVERKTEGEVIDSVRELERERDSGNVRKAGRAQTVEQWLTHWVENIAAPSVRFKTLEGYRTAVYVHLIPGLGAHRVNRIQPEHFEKLYAKMIRAGKPSAAHKVHTVARNAFGVAERRVPLARNPVALVKAPRVEEPEIEPFQPDEIQRVITAALKRRNGVRIVVALALGCRQGEALGFKWERLDRANRHLRVKKALQRQTWEHGCADPHVCGTGKHRKPCPVPCRRHRKPNRCVRDEKGHPRPCPVDCSGHASTCPQRHGGGLVEVEVKSRAGRRTFVLPDQLYDLLMRHEQAQQQERAYAGSEWHEGGWMFTQPNGRPIDARRDWAEWKSILTEAGVRDVRLHDARHTAATVLLLLGVHERVVMEVMGWSTAAMRKRYMHVTDELLKGVADQLNTYFWKDN
jgi:integrase